MPPEAELELNALAQNPLYQPSAQLGGAAPDWRTLEEGLDNGGLEDDYDTFIPRNPTPARRDDVENLPFDSRVFSPTGTHDTTIGDQVRASVLRPDLYQEERENRYAPRGDTEPLYSAPQRRQGYPDHLRYSQDWKDNVYDYNDYRDYSRPPVPSKQYELSPEEIIALAPMPAYADKDKKQMKRQTQRDNPSKVYRAADDGPSGQAGSKVAAGVGVAALASKSNRQLTNGSKRDSEEASEDSQDSGITVDPEQITPVVLAGTAVGGTAAASTAAGAGSAPIMGASTNGGVGMSATSANGGPEMGVTSAGGGPEMSATSVNGGAGMGTTSAGGAAGASAGAGAAGAAAGAVGTTAALSAAQIVAIVAAIVVVAGGVGAGIYFGVGKFNFRTLLYILCFNRYKCVFL